MARIRIYNMMMSSGDQVIDLDDLREFWDESSVLEYYRLKILEKWLESKEYETEAEKIRELNAEAIEFEKELHSIFGIPFERRSRSLNRICSDNQMRTELKTEEDRENFDLFLDNLVYSQEELESLINEGVSDILLAKGRYSINVSAKTRYYGLNEPIVVFVGELGDDLEIPSVVGCYITNGNMYLDERKERLRQIALEKRGDQFASTERYIDVDEVLIEKLKDEKLDLEDCTETDSYIIEWKTGRIFDKALGDWKAEEAPISELNRWTRLGVYKDLIYYDNHVFDRTSRFVCYDVTENQYSFLHDIFNDIDYSENVCLAGTKMVIYSGHTNLQYFDLIDQKRQKICSQFSRLCIEEEQVVYTAGGAIYRYIFGEEKPRKIGEGKISSGLYKVTQDVFYTINTDDPILAESTLCGNSEKRIQGYKISNREYNSYSHNKHNVALSTKGKVKSYKNGALAAGLRGGLYAIDFVNNNKRVICNNPIKGDQFDRFGNYVIWKAGEQYLSEKIV